MRWLIRLLVLALLGGAGYWGYSWYQKKSQNTPLEYKTAAIAPGEIVQQVTANGQISPVVNVLVGTQVSGIIKNVFADYNDRVTNGQVIAQLDSATFEQIIQQSKAELMNAQASLEYAKLNFNRAKSLRDRNLIADTEFDKAQVDQAQAEAQVKMREASLRKAQVDFDRTTIYAPIDGVVIARNVEMGQTVAASFNTPTLFTIANDLTKMRIQAAVSEADVGGVKEGQKVSFTVDAFPDTKFQGEVSQVRFEPTTVQNVVSYITVVTVDNSSLKLRPGMTANANIITAERKDVLRIPNSALRFRPPEKAIIKGNTNATAKADGGKSGGKGKGMAVEGLPTPPWTAEGRRPTEEERQKYMDSLTPEQRDLYQKARERMRAQFGGGSGERRATRTEEGPATRTVYLLERQTVEGKEQQVLRAVTIKTGISDGINTEVLDGLKEKDAVVTGVNQPAAATATASARPPSSPFGGSPFGGGPPRPPR
jgi:HlyD family secretion protein